MSFILNIFTLQICRTIANIQHKIIKMDHNQQPQPSIDLSQYEIKIISKPILLELKRSFNTAHSSSTTRTNFIIKSFLNTPLFAYQSQQNLNLQDKPISIGYGQCGLPPKKPYCYLADINDCEAFINEIIKELNCFQQQLKAAPLDPNLFNEFFKMLYNQVFGQIFNSEPTKTSLRPLIFFQQKFNSLLNSTDTTQTIPQMYFYMQVLFLFTKAKQYSTIHHEYKAAKNALQFSLLDLIGSISNQSVSQIICGQQDYIKENINYSFYTISHEEDLQSMLQNGKDSLKFTNCIKIKFNNDVQKLIDLLIMMDKQQVGSTWIVDANACWTPADYTTFQSKLVELSVQNPLILKKLLFIEQPFPIFKSLGSSKTSEQIQAEQIQWEKIKQNASLMIIADESFGSFEDLQSVLKYSHGINIKMEKCGGPLQAIKTLKQVQKRKIEHVMFGSMVSTHLGCTQTFQFYQFAKYFDIDGALLVKSPEIRGGFEWKGVEGIIKVEGSGLALQTGDIEKLI